MGNPRNFKDSNLFYKLLLATTFLRCNGLFALSICVLSSGYTRWEMLEFKEWLQPADSDPTRAYCKYCYCVIVIAEMYCLKQHITSPKHLKAVEPLKSQRKIEVPSVKGHLNTEKAEGTLALFICEHASIMAVDHLSQICKKFLVTSNDSIYVFIERNVLK